jgi:hypothetical protein
LVLQRDRPQRLDWHHPGVAGSDDEADGPVSGTMHPALPVPGQQVLISQPATSACLALPPRLSPLASASCSCACPRSLGDSELSGKVPALNFTQYLQPGGRCCIQYNPDGETGDNRFACPLPPVRSGVPAVALAVWRCSHVACVAHQLPPASPPALMLGCALSVAIGRFSM